MSTPSLPDVANVSNVSFSWTAPNLTINWVGTGDEYEVRVRGTSDSDWSDPYNGLGDSGIVIPGLTQGRYYQFEITTIRTDEVEETSLPDFYGFVIPQGLTAPYGCAVVAESATQITFTWQGIKNKTYLVEWFDQDGLSGSMTVVNNSPGATTTATITDLDPDKNYEIHIAQMENEELLYGTCYIDKAKWCCGPGELPPAAISALQEEAVTQ